jgi:Universal stress protein family
MRCCGRSEWPLRGDPNEPVFDETERALADFIFHGVHGHTRLDRFLLGSVFAAIASRAHCSAEVARTRREAAAECSLNRSVSGGWIGYASGWAAR